AYGFRGVVESSLERNLGIVQAVRVELHFGSAGTSTKEVDRSPFSHHFHRPLPRFGAANSFANDVTTTLLWRQRTDSFHHIRNFERLHDLVRAHVLGSFDLAIALYD